ncbi:Phosphoglycolate phosphatase [Methylophaga thiooxydans]|uniref:Phosphoglycolate phosphatase n=1 Tax=Methylophaga thiooxydans TaxID=392484 RepID=A0A0A0BGQ7_9GAMM|nr:phosphoglycolate phosphatase [Methylophaga thiooxydans]KGM06867.1 Phosphoglycolate phosphatase [Methylophaga thiooxydans]
MTLKKPSVVLIDLDGTLVDSVPDLAWVTDQMLDSFNLPPRGETKVRKWVGNGVKSLVKRALTDQLDGEPKPVMLEKAIPVFMALYEQHACVESSLYPGVKQGLAWLKQQRIRLGCVTNKDARFTLPILDKLGIHDDFDIVISGDTLPRKKPDPAPLLHGAEFFGVTPDKAMMIGDSVSDVKASRAAGFSIVCVSYGYNHGADIRTTEPDAVIDTFAELESLF